MLDIKSILREFVEELQQPSLMLKEGVEVSEHLQYHIENNLSLTNNVFRVYSNGYFNLVNEVRNLWEKELIELNEEDILMVESDLGKTAEFMGETVYLDAPVYVMEEKINEAEYRGKNVDLNKPFRTPGGPKKFAVYVKSPKGNVNKVTFGDPGLRVKNANKKAAKSFRARHHCETPGPRWKPRYWACRSW